MKARLILEIELTDGRARDLSRSEMLDALDQVEADLKSKLYREGYLPGSGYVVGIEFKQEIVD